ncbi:MAG TPA: oligopeptide transporter, OPT family [candidate division Zixibacteria bacterium]|jgi:putative OPT family oligopeptide transporter
MAAAGSHPHQSSEKPRGTAPIPYIASDQSIAEVTLKTIVLGSLISIVFGVANAYLGLKVGMTVSASIPAAVISMAVLRTLFRKVTVLENNIVQTIGSAGESLAAGIIFTIPAFLIWEATLPGFEYRITQWQIIGLSLLGGTLGILLMIPLRRYLVHKEHGTLAFPEGTACAEIIIAGDEGGGKAKLVFTGIGLGALYKLLMGVFRMWPESPVYGFKERLPGGAVGIDATPALLGVGYIIGPKIASLMMGGAVMGYLGIAPLIKYIGSALPAGLIPPADIPIGEMDHDALRGYFVKYLGVGAVALGGFVSLAKSLPVIIHSFSQGFGQLLKRGGETAGAVPRTDRDLSMSVVLIGSLAIAVAIWAFPSTELHFMGALLAILFGFFFVVVAARIVGLVGSSSSPVSGMTIATLLVTCLVLLKFGVSGVSGMVTAMSVGTVVCIAVCMSGDIAQDLKTGYLLGATPRSQQIVEFIGLFFPALLMGGVVFWLAGSFGFVASPEHPEPLQAPQANVMAIVVRGVMGGDLPWMPIIFGAVLAASIELVGIGSLPFAIGMYLPLELSSPIMAGGLIAMIVQKKAGPASAERQERGILFSSGLVAGDALVGVAVAGLMLNEGYKAFYDSHGGLLDSLSGAAGPAVSLIAFAAIALYLWTRTRIKSS